MKSIQATLALFAFWACIYLPGLGSREIRGEEWRRVLPARTMLNTGEWLVPYSGGQPYLRKPPLINWVTAASFKITGLQNEWTARLPSALLMLGAVLGIHAFTRRAMGAEPAFVGSLLFLTTIGCIEKGRIAELEVYYIAFTGLAVSAWLAGFMGKLNRWAAWLWVGLFLGLGFLAKGPMHLLFFYLIVLGACWKTKRWSDLRSLPHVMGLALCLGMILAWAIPFMGAYGRLMQVSGWDVLGAWQNEVSRRVTGEEETSLGDWLTRGPRALVMFLPWVLLVPVLWKRGAIERAIADGPAKSTLSGMAWGIVAGFTLMVLLPSSSARYVAPLLGPVAIMLGWLVTAAAPGPRTITIWRVLLVLLGSLLALVGGSLLASALDQRPPQAAMMNWLNHEVIGLLVAIPTAWLLHRWLKLHWSGLVMRHRILLTAVLLGAGSALIFSRLAATENEEIRSTAYAIRAAMDPKDGPLYIYHLGQVPYPFYLPEDSIELYDPPQLPSGGIRWMLTTAKIDQDFRPWFERRHGTATKVGQFTGTWGDASQDKNRQMVLLRFAGKP